jgi:hypothetical protein
LQREKSVTVSRIGFDEADLFELHLAIFVDFLTFVRADVDDPGRPYAVAS